LGLRGCSSILAVDYGVRLIALCSSWASSVIVQEPAGRVERLRFVMSVISERVAGAERCGFARSGRARSWLEYHQDGATGAVISG
jgi:hypothetical protein